MKLDEKYQQFLKDEVYKPMGIEEITEENIEDIYYYIVENFEVPYTQDGDKRLCFVLDLLNTLSLYIKWNNAKMNIEFLDIVLLKDGRKGTVLEIYNDGEAFEIDIVTPDGEYDTMPATIRYEEIERIIEKNDISSPLDDVAGPLCVPSNTRLRVRALLEYAKFKGVSTMELSEEEVKMFEYEEKHIDLNKMKIELYDRVLLKDGRTASIVEIFKDGEAFIADIDIAKDEYDTDTIFYDEIEKVIKH